MKIGLGTAQLGLVYGIGNRLGQTPEAEVSPLLALAEAGGVAIVDTAAQYGDSESRLGRHLSPNSPLAIVTKTPAFDGPITEAEADLLEATFRRSLERLRRPRVHGLLLHGAGDTLHRPGAGLLVRRMRRLQEQGLVGKIGASVYGGDDLEGVLERYSLEIVQLPVNLFDQRLLAGAWPERFHARGVEVHARSPFLQGILLMDPREVPASLAPLGRHLERVIGELGERGLTPMVAALGFACSLEWVTGVICGVVNAAQLGEILEAARHEVTPALLRRFAFPGDPLYLNPHRWSRL
ncbi:MAG: aldo/keto reductase [Magnetococcales bacterium]|nr:aldo/keto reductase [Magnetococcales bacterium]MBF0157186.1 aldo/keto reductase [Magnetococcales bacterium]